MTGDPLGPRLSPDALEAAAALERILPRPFHVLGVERARAVAAGLRPEGPPESIAETRPLTLVGRNGTIPARLYRPDTESALPIAVYLHGGGWTVGSLDGIDPVCRALANRSGCAVVSIDYRLAPEHKFPTPLHDCLDSVEYLIRHEAELGLDAGRIALVGDSAGGNLAAGVAIACRGGTGPSIAGLVLAYPAVEYGVIRPSWVEYADGPLITTADVDWFWRNYFRDKRDHANPLAVPSAAASLAGLPPSLVITAAVDPLRDGAEAFARRLQEDGGQATILRYDGVFHGFFTELGTFAATDVAASEAARFLKSILTT